MKHISFRIDDTLLKKFHYVCQSKHRSANKQMLLMIEQTVARYEERNGEITSKLLEEMYRGDF